MEPISNLYKKTQCELFNYVREFVASYGNDVFNIATGKDNMFLALFPKHPEKPYPVLASHLDIYHGFPPDEVEVIEETKNGIRRYKGKRKKIPNILGADDRNGVWTMLQLIEKGYHNWGYIFTMDEEIGLLGAKGFVKSPEKEKYLDKIGYFVQIDRMGTNELVHYRIEIEGNIRRCHGNKDFICNLEKFSSHTIVESPRSTDVKEYCKATRLCGINISAGYCKEHSSDEYSDIAYVDKLPDTIVELVNLLGYRKYEIEL